MPDRALKSSKFLVREGKADIRLKNKAALPRTEPCQGSRRCKEMVEGCHPVYLATGGGGSTGGTSARAGEPGGASARAGGGGTRAGEERRINAEKEQEKERMATA